jgi:hypothetical protein
MDAYDVCIACACHIKREEPTCPLCGALHTPKARARSRLLPRMSRAEWLAFGSTLAVVGCTEHFPRPPPSQQVADATMAGANAADDAMALETGTADDSTAPESGMVDDSTTPESGLSEHAMGPEADLSDRAASPEAGATDGAALDAGLPVGAFFCGWGAAAFSCDRATQFCFSVDGLGGVACVAHDSGTFEMSRAVDGAVLGRTIPPQCAPSFPCACLLEAGFADPPSQGSGCFCRDLDDAGAIGINCGCYGSPPARLERLLRTLS